MKIEVMKIEPKELPRKYYYRLNYIYEKDLSEFVLMFDAKEMKLFINAKRVSDQDIGKFLQVLNYQGKYINDPDSEVSDILTFIYKKYGSDMYLALLDGYEDCRKYEMNEAAKKAAPKIVRMIERYEQKEEFSFSDEEYLIYHIVDLVRKTSRKTLYNMIGYDEFYVLMYGYLLGKGIISRDS